MRTRRCASPSITAAGLEALDGQGQVRWTALADHETARGARAARRERRPAFRRRSSRRAASRSDAIARLAKQALVSLRQDRVDRDPFAEPQTRFDGQTGLSKPDRRLTARAGRARSSGSRRLAATRRVPRRAAARRHRQRQDRDLPAARGRRFAAAAGRVLMLVPEIALTPAVAALFRQAFGERVAIQHSGLSDGERHDQWQRIRRGDIDVVVGTRSAVFAPLERVGLIVVDEEHDGVVQAGGEPALQRPRRRDRPRRSAPARSSCSARRRRRWRATTTRWPASTSASCSSAACSTGRSPRSRSSTCARSTPRTGPDVILSRALRDGDPARGSSAASSRWCC